MNEIREGLEQGLDISQYNQLDPQGHPIYDWWQMEEIHKGLKRPWRLNLCKTKQF
ncbi:hypothetical protein [Metamycoplasma hominis]|uniref:hypothetical protein n=1 Tax=Metamycoplasma hominis TaxID=2098 RepID=UPI001E47BDD8|nr:hypothetical protein [Metamycoplasma hominis]